MVIAAEAVMVNAADAILTRDGFRIRGKTSSHAARFGYPGLPDEFREERRSSELIRNARNRALYEQVDQVSEDLAGEALRVAEALLAAARRAIG